MSETRRFDPLLPPSEEAQSVFQSAWERNPLADMRAIPNEWLLKERGHADAIANRLARAEELLDMASQVLEDENVGSHVIRKIEPFLAGEE